MGLGLPDQFLEHGAVEELYQGCALDVQSLIELIRARVDSLKKHASNQHELRYFGLQSCRSAETDKANRS